MTCKIPGDKRFEIRSEYFEAWRLQACPHLALVALDPFVKTVGLDKLLLVCQVGPRRHRLQRAVVLHNFSSLFMVVVMMVLAVVVAQMPSKLVLVAVPVATMLVLVVAVFVISLRIFRRGSALGPQRTRASCQLVRKGCTPRLNITRTTAF